jgi:hypothetical protein
MPEGMNLEVAHRLSEKERAGRAAAAIVTEYRNPRLEEAQRLNDRASMTFDEETEAARPPAGTCG